MIDHFGFYVRDAGISLPFYQACLPVLGIEVVEVQFRGKAMIFKNTAQNAFIWIGEPGKDDPRTARPGISPIHLGLTAPEKDDVDRFHAAAVAAGGTDNGKPGWRGLNVYAAFVLDPDGNNIEADWRP